MRRFLASTLLVLVGVLACGRATTASQPTTSGASPVVSTFTPVPDVTPLSTPTPPPVNSLAVLVDLFAGSDTYDIALVAGDGRVVARDHALKRSSIADAAALPYVSASNSRLYYLDGDRDVRYLKANGVTGVATSVPGGVMVHAAFAVSPDDSRIAVSLLDYSVNPVLLTMYVEDVGGAHHSVILTSTTEYVWPVAWRAGHLVVANFGAPPFSSQAINYTNGDRELYPYGANPYGANNYYVINPSTARREVSVGGGGVSGLLSRAGSAMVQVGVVDWTGRSRSFVPNVYEVTNAIGSLSPAGRGLAVCCDQNGHFLIFDSNGYVRWLQDLGDAFDWIGWMDGGHIVTGFYQRSNGTPSVIDISYVPEAGVVLDKSTPVDAHGFVAAILPGSIDP